LISHASGFVRGFCLGIRDPFFGGPFWYFDGTSDYQYSRLSTDSGSNKPMPVYDE